MLETDRQTAIHQLSTNRIQEKDYSKYIYMIIIYTLIWHSYTYLEIFFYVIIMPKNKDRDDMIIRIEITSIIPSIILQVFHSTVK